MGNSKTIKGLTGRVKSGNVLKGLNKGDTVLYKNKKYKFVEYRDYGFTCIIKSNDGKQIFVCGNEITKTKA